MLIEQNLFGTVDKVEAAITLLREHEPPEGYYLCFSGGKDSIVVYDLCKRANVKFDAHHNITTVEPPQLMKFIRDNYPDVVNEHPPKSMYQLILHYKIPPLKNARYFCRDLKEIGGKGRVKVTGIRADESPRRAKRKLFEPSYDGKTFFCTLSRIGRRATFGNTFARTICLIASFTIKAFQGLVASCVLFKITTRHSAIFRCSLPLSTITDALAENLSRLIKTNSRLHEKALFGIQAMIFSIGGLTAGKALGSQRIVISFRYFPRMTALSCEVPL